MGLPVAPSELHVPEYFSPSSLGTSKRCGLKVLASASENRGKFERLPVNPVALLGTLVHSALELLMTGELTEPLQWLEDELDRPTNRATPYSCLREAIPERRIQNARQMLDGRDGRSELVPREHPEGLRTAGANSTRLFGPEVLLISPTLRLRGKADWICRLADGAIEIVDFKTGVVLGENGEVKDEYVLQLQAYALMLRERVGGTEVRLFLDNGERTQIPCDDVSLDRAQERIEEFTSKFPESSTVHSVDVANPGPECASCGLRSSCSAYLDSAPDWWTDVPEEIEFAPLDIWGEISRVSEVDFGLTVHLKDQAGRSVKVDGLDSAHGLTRDSAGEQVWLFNLCADNRRRGFKGQRPHPRIFHELVRTDALGPRAWSISVFLG